MASVSEWETAAGKDYSDNPLSGSGYTESQVNHIGGTIRNNFVFASISQADTGIGLESAWNVNVYHNTVYGDSYADIDIRFASSNPDLRNNLSKKALTIRDSGQPRINQGNVTTATAAMFVNATNGDLHLVSGATAAINKGVSLAARCPPISMSKPEMPRRMSARTSIVALPPPTAW